MKRRHISKFLFSISLLIVTNSFHSQEKKEIDSVTTKQYPQRYGLRVGADLFKLSRSFYDPNYQGLELVGDFRFSKLYYIAAEIGNENITVQEDNLNFTTKGSYLKVGFDYNLHQNWLNQENMIYVGLRYGIAAMSQTRNSYRIYNASPYFGQSQLISDGLEFSGLSAQWAEVVAGIKTRLFNNVFVGFSFRGNILLLNNKPTGFDNLYITGYNRTYNGSFGVGFNYSVSYMLPVYKKKPKAARVVTKP